MDTVYLCTNCNYWYKEKDSVEVITHHATMTDPEERSYLTPCCKQDESEVSVQFDNLTELLDELNKGRK
jgi:hypothetical protein